MKAERQEIDHPVICCRIKGDQSKPNSAAIFKMTENDDFM